MGLILQLFLLLLYALSFNNCLPITSTPLEDNPDHLTWDDLSNIHSYNHQEARKIPKSIFIAPHFNVSQCPSGYSLREDGKCYKDNNIQINAADLLKQQLDSLFIGSNRPQPTTDYEYDYEDSTESDGPFHVGLSLSFSNEMPENNPLPHSQPNQPTFHDSTEENASKEDDDDEEENITANINTASQSTTSSSTTTTTTPRPTAASVKSVVSTSSAPTSTTSINGNVSILDYKEYDDIPRKDETKHQHNTQQNSIATDSIASPVLPAPLESITHIDTEHSKRESSKESFDSQDEVKKIPDENIKSGNIAKEDTTSTEEYVNGNQLKEDELKSDALLSASAVLGHTSVIYPQASGDVTTEDSLENDEEEGTSEFVTVDESKNNDEIKPIIVLPEVNNVEIVTPAQASVPSLIASGPKSEKLTEYQTDMLNIDNESDATKRLTETINKHERNSEAIEKMDQHNRFVYNRLGSENQQTQEEHKVHGSEHKHINSETAEHHRHKHPDDELEVIPTTTTTTATTTTTITTKPPKQLSLLDQLQFINKHNEENRRLQRIKFQESNNAPPIANFFPNTREAAVKFPGPVAQRRAPNLRNQLIPPEDTGEAEQQLQQQQHPSHSWFPPVNGWQINRNSESNNGGRPVLLRFWNKMPLFRDGSRATAASPSIASDTERTRENSKSPTDSLYKEETSSDIYKVLTAKNSKNR